MQAQLIFFFRHPAVPPQQQVLFMVTYMRGSAEKWIHPFVKKYWDEPDDDDTRPIRAWIENFARFKVELRRTFGQSNEVSTAIRAIQYLTQTVSAADYATKFQRYAVITGWDDDALMTMFRNGLKDDVKDELMRSGASLQTMSALISESIRLDDMLYDRKWKRNTTIIATGKAIRVTEDSLRPLTDIRSQIRTDTHPWNWM